MVPTRRIRSNNQPICQARIELLARRFTTVIVGLGLFASNRASCDSGLNLDTLNLAEVSDNAELSEAVYHKDVLSVGGWLRVEFVKSPNGLQWGLYEKTLGKGKKDWRLVFAGTQDWRDLATDANQALSHSGLFRSLLPVDAQYSEALEIASRWAKLKDQNPNLSFSVTGHSLGGGLAQYVATVLGVKAMVFDAAAMGNHTLDTISKSLWQNVGRQIIHVTMQGEPVHEFTRSWFGGTHVGIEFSVKPFSSMPRDPASLHSMVELISALKSLAGLRDPGVTPENSGVLTDAIISQRFAVPREIAEIWGRDVKVLATGLRELKLLSLDHKWAASLEGSDTFKQIGRKPGEEWLKGLEWASTANEAVNALEKDFADSRDWRFVLVRSHTVELLTRKGLENVFKRTYEILDNRKLIPFQAEVFLNGSKAELGTPTFGLLEVVSAGFQRSRAGHLDVDSITSYFDAAVGLTWGVWGLAASGGNLKVAEIYQDAGQALAQTLRSSSRGGFQQLVAWNRGQANTIVAMWRQSQEIALYRGAKLQSIEEWLGEDAKATLAASGVGDDTLRELRDEHRHRTETTTMLSSQVPNTILLGGGSSAEAAGTSQTYDGLANARKAIVFGNGPQVRGIYEQLVASRGQNNVRLVDDVTSTYECNRLAREFAADTIVRSVHCIYRDLTRAGFTSRPSNPEGTDEIKNTLNRDSKKPIETKLGGVDMDIQPKRIEGTNASNFKKLLKKAPSGDPLYRDISAPPPGR